VGLFSYLSVENRAAHVYAEKSPSTLSTICCTEKNRGKRKLKNEQTSRGKLNYCFLEKSYEFVDQNIRCCTRSRDILVGAHDDTSEFVTTQVSSWIRTSEVIRDHATYLLVHTTTQVSS